MKLTGLLIAIYFLPLCSYADGGKDSIESQESENYSKTGKQFIPGEEVVTPTGKRMRVWNTTGPVPVQRAPEPFQKTPAEQGLGINSVGVIVDPGRNVQRDRQAATPDSDRRDNSTR